MKANNMSTDARKACKALHFSPTDWEPVNADKQGFADSPDSPEYVVIRAWNSKRTVELTNHDLSYAHEYL